MENTIRFKDVSTLIKELGDIDINEVWDEFSSHYMKRDIRMMELENSTLTRIGLMEKIDSWLLIDIIMMNSKYYPLKLDKDNGEWVMIYEEDI